MYYLIEWHRETPTVPPVGAVNVPPKIWKIKKIHIFEDFWELFFLIKYIGFSLKYENPKSPTDFCHRKNIFQKKKLIFFFWYVSSPTSENFIAPLLLYNALDQKRSFFVYSYGFGAYSEPTFCVDTKAVKQTVSGKNASGKF